MKPHRLLNTLICSGLCTTLLYITYSNLLARDITPGETIPEYFSEVDPTKNPPEILRVAKTAPEGKQKNDTPRNITQVKTYGQLSKFLCSTQRKRSKDDRKLAAGKKPCPSENGIVTVYPAGRTGNCMWEYSAVLAISRITQQEPYVADCLRRKLDLVFEDLTIPTFAEIAHCPFNFSNTVHSFQQYNYLSNQDIIVKKLTTFLLSLIVPELNSIKREFSVRKELKAKAQLTLNSIVKTKHQEHTFVGVHVRRTDYLQYLHDRYNTTPIPKQFLERAMMHYKAKYTNCVFVYVSDDPTWCFEQFGSLSDVAVPSYNATSSPAEDLALIAACNHTIFDYGTFGEWGALLAGGDVIYNRAKKRIGKLKNWKKMS